MGNMRQPKSDYGRSGETGERVPKGAAAADRGQRSIKVPERDKESGSNNRGLTGEREPGGAKSRDASGERKVGIVGGVGMGERDKLTGREESHKGKFDGNTGEHNTGTQGEGHFYKHGKGEYPMGHKMAQKRY